MEQNGCATAPAAQACRRADSALASRARRQTASSSRVTAVKLHGQRVMAALGARGNAVTAELLLFGLLLLVSRLNLLELGR
jgi:hypothetical protein